MLYSISEFAVFHIRILLDFCENCSIVKYYGFLYVLELPKIKGDIIRGRKRNRRNDRRTL